LDAGFAAHGPSRRTFRWWKTHQPALAGVDDFAALVAELRDPTTTPEREDARIGALVALARSDNDALVALLIVLLPRLRAKVRRYGIGLDTDDAHAEIIAALISQVRRHNLGRRPHRVAPKLVWYATRQLRQARNRNNAWRTNTVALAGIDTAIPSTGPTRDGVEISAPTTMQIAVRDGILTATDAALITATGLAGLPLRDAAALLGLSYEAARKRRQRAQAALRSYLADPTTHP
jgi:DNA-directed RNA polymerase specialized sigma24 family protein